MEKIPVRADGGSLNFNSAEPGYREIAFVVDGEDYTAGIEHINKLLSEGWTVKMAKPFSISGDYGNGRMLIILRNGPARGDFNN